MNNDERKQTDWVDGPNIKNVQVSDISNNGRLFTTRILDSVVRIAPYC